VPDPLHAAHDATRSSVLDFVRISIGRFRPKYHSAATPSAIARKKTWLIRISIILLRLTSAFRLEARFGADSLQRLVQ